MKVRLIRQLHGARIVCVAVFVAVLVSACNGTELPGYTLAPTWTTAPVSTSTSIFPATPQPPTLTAVPSATPTSLTLEQIVQQGSLFTARIEAVFGKSALNPDGSATSGTGIVLDVRGHLVTAAHVVEGASSISVYIAGERHPRAARIIARASADDLIVLKIDDTRDLVPVRFADSDSTPLGARVVALGFPGSIEPSEPSVSEGIISKKGAAYGTYRSLVIHSAGLNPGFSGGPLLNDKAQLVGINVLFSPAEGALSYYAIPSSYTKPIIAELKRGVSRQYIGVGFIPNKYPDYYKTDRGVVVDRVTPNSPSARIGLESWDLLLSVSGLTVTSETEVYDLVRTHPTEELDITVIRIDSTSVRYQCEGSFTPGDTSSATGRQLTCQRMDPPPPPPPPCESSPPDWRILLCDGFDTPRANSWWFGTEPYFDAAIQDGKYAFSIHDQRGYMVPSLANDLAFVNGTIDTSVYIVGDGVAGVTARWIDSRNWVDCWIDRARRYTCFAMEDGTHRPLTQDALSTSIQPDNFNRLTLTVIDDRLVFTINGETVVDIGGIPVRRGQAGLFTATGQGADSITAFFEDARIWEYTKP